MKVLTVSDLVSPILYPRIQQGRFPNVDLIISCGDLPPEYLTSLVSVFDAPMYYVRDNHDLRYRDKPPSGPLTCMETFSIWNVLNLKIRQGFPQDRIDRNRAVQVPDQTDRIPSYFYLQDQVSEAPTFNQAAQDWYNTIYCPMVTIIEKARLMESFPDRTSADLFTYIACHQWELGRTRKYGFGIDVLIPNNMEVFRTKMANMTAGGYPDMQRWITTFVLMNVTAKHERKIMDKLFAIQEIKEVHSVHGAFDLIVKIVLSRDLLCSDAEVIGDFVQSKIRIINGVKATQTLIPGLSKIK